MNEELMARARRVRLVVFDVDGVLTEGFLTYGPTGEATKTFSVHDGHGIVLLRLAGLITGILSARDSEIVRTRMRELGVRHVLQGWRDKGKGLEKLCALTELNPDEIAYMGDDVNDVPVLSRVGLAGCPANARDEAKAHAHFVANENGGRGAARAFCELILKAQGKWVSSLP